MSFDFDDAGNFGSRREAEEWAKRNNIDPRDLHIREDSRGCDVGVRRSAIPSGGFDDADKRRKDGFF
ncbi:hypothetical protein HNO88_002518 [Novosphingobium chloroacetimidivorans]|uniref:Uncharacterized protein n=1 Tax=Novosphingobium chloroacetimidivorans TaxID=1428314 RepID=A0A7W7NX90_9SPHN|nr:hypothetical protein [Novosphingobium chloroacetimidivorans]MBB4859189.1 hypothetical protein [Novosphingobium chloroacetimidivorans]